MKTYKKPFKVSCLFILLLTLINISQISWGADAKPLWETLTASQQETLKAGKQVFVAEVVPNAVWPRFHVYRLISAAPRDMAAVFWDIMDDPNYVPDCMKVVVNSRPAPNVVEATFTMHVPLLSPEISRSRTEVTLLPNNIYNNTWTILSSKYSQSGDGSFVIVPHEQGSLVCYTNFCVPKSSFASVLRKQIEKDIQAIVQALAQRVEYQMKENSQHHVEQLAQIDAAVKQ